jgi:hypothetical protein
MASVPENIIVLWPGANGSIPSGWARVTSYDGRFFKARVSGSAGNAGATSHGHSAPAHTHAMPSHNHSGQSAQEDNSYGLKIGSGTNSGGANDHTHTATTTSVTGGTSGSTTPTFSDTTIEPPYSEMIAIKSDGSPAGFPDDCVVYYNNASAPTGWTDHADSRDKFIKAPAGGGNGGTEGGGGSHTHAGASHTHTAPGTHDHAGITVSETMTQSSSASCSCGLQGVPSHDHTWDANAGAAAAAGAATSANTAAQTYVPPYYVLLGIQNTSGADNWLEQAIVMFEGAVGDVPDDWTICNGDNNVSGNATPSLDGKYILMASDGGSVGGSCGTAGHDHCNPSGHTHTQSHTHSATALSNIGFTGGGKQMNSAGNKGYHGHPSFTTGANSTTYSGTAQSVNATANTEPIHRTILYLSAPPEPSAAGSAAMFGASF